MTNKKIKRRKASKSEKSIKRRNKLQRDSFLDTRILECVENNIVDNIDEAYFPSILNLNPVNNAHELTLEDSRVAYNALYASFNALKEGTSVHPLLEKSILYSHSQFLYFSIFFKELEKINSSSDLGFAEELKIPYKLKPKKEKATKENTFLIQPPLYLEKVRDKYRIKYKTFGSCDFKNKTPLILHRFNYISRFLELNDFREGFPAWYALGVNGHVSIFEKYIPQLNQRVRIRWNKNEFEYHISGASDNWQKIYDVPVEMDSVIAALLFRN